MNAIDYDGSEMSQHETFNEGLPLPTRAPVIPHMRVFTPAEIEERKQRVEQWQARNDMPLSSRWRLAHLNGFISWAELQRDEFKVNPSFVPDAREMERRFDKRYGVGHADRR